MVDEPLLAIVTCQPHPRKPTRNLALPQAYEFRVRSWTTIQRFEYTINSIVSTPHYLRPQALYQVTITLYSIMQLPSISSTFLLALALHSGVNAAASDNAKKPLNPCTIASTTGSFYDLRPLSVLPPTEGKKPGKNDKTSSWHARGYDYKSNFTLNICAPVVEDLERVVDVDKPYWKNISAFYEFEHQTYSLG